MYIPTCPHCGSPLPAQNPFYGMPVKERIFEFITKHPGCTGKDIHTDIYNDEDTYDVLSAHISQMKPRLADVGLRLHVTRGPGAKYRITKAPTP